MGEEGSKTSGCLAGGCGCLVIAVIAVVAFVIIMKPKVTGLIEKEVAQYVATEPTELPPVVADSEKIDAVIVRFDRFRSALDEGKTGQQLELTSEEVNILIAHHPQFSDVADRARVKLDGERITAAVSIPLDAAIPIVGGRFLNGSAECTLTMKDGVPSLFIEQVMVNGMPLKQTLMTEIRKQNLLEDNADFLGTVDSIAVRNSLLIMGSGD